MFHEPGDGSIVSDTGQFFLRSDKQEEDLPSAISRSWYHLHYTQEYHIPPTLRQDVQK